MAIDKTGKWWIGSEIVDLQAYLAELTGSEGGYPATVFKLVRCDCGSEEFKLRRSADVTQRTCANCAGTAIICLEIEDWEEAIGERRAKPFRCVECRFKNANVVVGFACYEGAEMDGVKWHYVGVRCAGCGVLGCFNDGKIGWGPTSEVLERA